MDDLLRAAAQAESDLLPRLAARADCRRWELPAAAFHAALDRSVRHRFGGARPAAVEVAAYLDSLHLDDLALACACADGHAAAWDHLVEAFRPKLLAAARAIAGPDNAPELADSVFADLYGLKERGGERQSLFRYFYGRSSLATWLRAVLARKHVDARRAESRLRPLEVAAERAAEAAVPDLDRPRLVAGLAAAVAAALEALDARDRLRLVLYYARQMKQAQIGRLLGESEATVSRRLDRIRRDLRRRVAQALAAQGLGPGDISRAWTFMLDDSPVDLIQRLEQLDRRPDASAAAAIVPGTEGT
jgi:RNA polymerase sigma-70 factor, ECF subfamily